MAHLTADLAAADTHDAVIEIAMTRVAALVHAAIAILMLTDDGLVTLVGSPGMRPDLPSDGRRSA